MKAPGLALVTAAALGIGAAASAYAASDRIQLAQDQSAPAGQRQSTGATQSTTSGGEMKARGGGDARGGMKAGDGGSARGGVNVRAKVGTGSSTSRTVVRKRDAGPDVVVRRSRTRQVIATEGRPSKVTVVKKNKKFAKKKKRTRVIAAAPASRAVIVKKRRPGVIVGGESRTTRTTISRERSDGVNVRARTGGSVNVRSRSEGSSSTTTGQGRSGAGRSQGSPSSSQGSPSSPGRRRDCSSAVIAAPRKNPGADEVRRDFIAPGAPLGYRHAEAAGGEVIRAAGQIDLRSARQCRRPSAGRRSGSSIRSSGFRRAAQSPRPARPLHRCDR